MRRTGRIDGVHPSFGVREIVPARGLADVGPVLAPPVAADVVGKVSRKGPAGREGRQGSGIVVIEGVDPVRLLVPEPALRIGLVGKAAIVHRVIDDVRPVGRFHAA